MLYGNNIPGFTVIVKEECSYSTVNVYSPLSKCSVRQVCDVVSINTYILTFLSQLCESLTSVWEVGLLLTRHFQGLLDNISCVACLHDTEHLMRHYYFELSQDRVGSSFVAKNIIWMGRIFYSVFMQFFYSTCYVLVGVWYCSPQWRVSCYQGFFQIFLFTNFISKHSYMYANYSWL